MFMDITKRARVEHDSGLLVSSLLAGSWRESPQPADISESELTSVLPLLCQSGTGALAWSRIRSTALAGSIAGQRLYDAYRQFRLSALIHEREIAHVLSLLRGVGIEPVLVKGWSSARRYPEQALRPYGDIDLCVRPDQLEKAAAALQCLEQIDGHHVDLHAGFTSIGMGTQRRARLSGCDSWDELFARSRVVSLGDQTLRILGDEDQLRIVCLHLLRSGALRPPWLCDVALLVESRRANFNWDTCLGRDRLHADWVACTIGLAQQLLSACIGDTPITERTARLPRWLAPAVLRQWGRPREHYLMQIAPAALREMNTPGRMNVGSMDAQTAFGKLFSRWDNPARATARLRGRFNNWPRLPYQLGELLLRSPEVPRQLRIILRPRTRVAGADCV